MITQIAYRTLSHAPNAIHKSGVVETWVFLKGEEDLLVLLCGLGLGEVEVAVPVELEGC
jgi:uncharacterized protein (UPF0218 family)